MLPEGLLGNLSGFLTYGLVFSVTHPHPLFNLQADIGRCLIPVVISTVHHLHSILNLSIVPKQSVYPQAEARQVRCHRRHPESGALQRSVAPRLIVRREYRQILPDKQVIVCLVEYAVITVQIARHKQHLYIILRSVTEPHALQSADNIILTHIVQPVRGERHGQRLLAGILHRNAVLQVTTGFHHPGRHINQRQDMRITGFSIIPQMTQ